MPTRWRSSSRLVGTCDGLAEVVGALEAYLPGSGYTFDVFGSATHRWGRNEALDWWNCTSSRAESTSFRYVAGSGVRYAHHLGSRASTGGHRSDMPTTWAAALRQPPLACRRTVASGRPGSDGGLWHVDGGEWEADLQSWQLATRLQPC